MSRFFAEKLVIKDSFVTVAASIPVSPDFSNIYDQKTSAAMLILTRKQIRNSLKFDQN